MDTIKRIETIDLLKGVWEFIQHKYKTKDFKSDMWAILRTKEY